MPLSRVCGPNSPGFRAPSYSVQPAPVFGLGSTGGFQYVLEALQGQSPSDLAAVMRGLVVTSNQQPELAAVFSTFAADTPQIPSRYRPRTRLKCWA